MSHAPLRLPPICFAVAAFASTTLAAAAPVQAEVSSAFGQRVLGGAPTLWATAVALVAATVVGGIVYLAARLISHRRAKTGNMPAARTPMRAAVGALLLLAGLLLVVTVVVYQASVRSTVSSTRRMLSTLAEVQARSIAQDRTRLEAGALAFASSRLISEDVEQWRASGSDASRDRLRLLLAEAARAFGFQTAELWTSNGTFIVGTLGTPQRPDLRERLGRVAATGQLTAVPPPRDASQGAIAGFLVNMPVATSTGAEACCVLFLEASGRPEAHPLLATILYNTRTAEALLVRPDERGGSIVTAALGATRADTARSLPADPYAFAATRERPGTSGLGTDHGGQSVLAVRAEIPGSSSSLVVKIDKDEILTGARTSAFLSAALALVLLLLALAVGRGLWQKNRLREAARELKATRAVNAAEARFRAAFDQAASGMMNLSPEGIIVRANGTACALLGRMAEELVGRSVESLRDAADTGAREDPVHALVVGEAPLVHTEERYLRRNGGAVWLACTFSLVRDHGGTPDHILLVMQDVTARRAAEAALRESEERFDLAVKGSDQGVWDFDVRSGRLYLSPRARELLGIGPQTPDDMKHVWNKLLHRADRRKLVTAWARLIRGEEQSFECEVRLLLPDGSYNDFLSHGLAARDDHGGVTRLVGMIADISERKQTERRLRLSAAVFASSMEGLVVTDLDAIVSAVNPAFTRITGYAPEEIIGKTMRIMHSGRHDREFYRRMWDALNATGSWQGEIWNRRKNGEIFLQQLTINTVYDQAGVPQSYVGAFQDITQIKHSEFQLDRIAHYDPLTDLPNRTLLASLLDLAVNRPDKACAVIFIDLDRFKTVNDSLGHLVGDQVLQMAAARVKAALDSSATAGRYGADEFVVILEEVDGPDDASSVAIRLIYELSTPFVLADGREVYLGASAGISLYPEDADSAQRLLQHADSALAEAKSHGRGSYAFYTKALTRSARIRMEMEADLRRGLARDEFRLNFQPVVSLATGRIHGSEALVRWHSPVHGLVTPNRFIPLAEETGLIDSLGAWVMEEACRQMADWLAKGADLDFIAVNLSPRQFRRESLSEQVEDILRRTGLPAARLEVEITENVLFEVRAPAERKLRQLKDLGVRVALDDFGTGYSSLAYLKRFPITKLKIDRSFVRDLPRAADGEIATAIISIARALGIEVVAEGIESPEQCEFLRARGCDFGQGHLFSRPVTGERFLRLVLQGPLPHAPPAALRRSALTPAGRASTRRARISRSWCRTASAGLPGTRCRSS
ncbi:EAL domain-containing protein [Xanthobacter dioxanivorans]|uniref:EAL domain-containing protein n=1 Tax=Xanthobacter dioxanivorans TaxID=2528964 RepID=A0A974PLX6_9HYPH|nr:bifunctional diguanylate cyclase/phosphodiesterase [Xanthobacter dioxanivorans]QRG05984.1 EAL domain-containing protein [Xanthobacter dioxanivorans]